MSHEAFYPMLLAELPGCPLPLVRSALNRSAAEFCAASLAWQEDLDPIQVATGIAEYELDLPADSQLVVIRKGELKINGRPLLPISNASAVNPSVTGSPTHYFQRGYGAVGLYPNPSDATGLLMTVRAVLKPTATASSLPAILADRYYEGVSEGAKAILKRMPGKAWSDPAGAALSYQLQKTEAAKARISNEAGFVAGSMSMTPRKYGR